jgi:hypothetical protein
MCFSTSHATKFNKKSETNEFISMYTCMELYLCIHEHEHMNYLLTHPGKESNSEPKAVYDENSSTHFLLDEDKH